MDWIEPSDLKIGQAVAADLRSHKRLQGRVVDRRPGKTWIRRRDGVCVEVEDSRVLRVKLVEGTFDSGDAVVSKSSPPWRGGVVRTEGSMVLVETKYGFVWVEESDIVDPVLSVASKPGPVSSDPVLEAINDEVFARSGRGGWAS